MSSQQHSTLLDVDDNDLNFDLDDIDEMVKTQIENIVQVPFESQNVPVAKKRKSPSPERPTGPPSPKNSYIEIKKIVNDKENKTFTPVRNSTSIKRVSNDRFETHNQSLLGLFDDHDQQPVEKQQQVIDIFSSTQMTQNHQNVQNNNKKKVFEGNQSSIIDQQIQISPEKLDNSKSIDKICVQNLNQDQIFACAKEDIIEQLNSLHLSTSLLEKYSIKNCIYKVYKYCLLKNEMRTKNEVFRIPFAFGRIMRIDKLSPSAVVYLQDDSSGIMCTISTSCTKKYSDYIAVGSVLAFESACIIRLSSSKSSYNIIIDLNNLISIYYLNTNGENEDDVSNNNSKKATTIETVKIKTLNVTELNKNIKQFERNLSNVDAKTIDSATSTTNSSILNSNNCNTTATKNANSLFNANKSANSNVDKSNNNYSSNNNNNMNRNQQNQIFNKPSVNYKAVPTTNSSSSSSSSSNTIQINGNKTSIVNSSNSNQMNANKNTSYQNLAGNSSEINRNDNNQNKRSFQFNRNTNKETVDRVGINSCVNNVTQNTNRSNALSQDVFSQLIFGIEDELLNEDD